MQFGYVILYVPDVAKAMKFYEAAFGLGRRFLHGGGMYGEMETGATTLAFAAEAMAEGNNIAIRPSRPRDAAPAVEVALVTPAPAEAFERAIKAGARAAKRPEKKPWGQTVAYVRDLNGFLVELCSPIAR